MFFPTCLHFSKRSKNLQSDNRNDCQREIHPKLLCSQSERNFISTTLRVTSEVQIVRSLFQIGYSPGLAGIIEWLAEARRWTGSCTRWICVKKVVCVEMKTETSSGHRCSFVFITVAPCVYIYTYIYNIHIARQNRGVPIWRADIHHRRQSLRNTTVRSRLHANNERYRWTVN